MKSTMFVSEAVLHFTNNLTSQTTTTTCRFLEESRKMSFIFIYCEEKTVQIHIYKIPNSDKYLSICAHL